MSCPFYAHSLMKPISIQPLILRLQDPPILPPEWMFVPNPTSNQCAIITGAHSPCRMETEEHADPNWARCIRNPAMNGTGPEW